MLKGKEGKIMSRYTVLPWASKPEVLKGMVEHRKKIEEMIEFYTNFKSEGNEEALGEIVENYKKELKELEKEYQNARGL